MALSAKLELRQGQQLVMTPQLQQAIRLLQLSNLELAQFVESELERNPLLERDESTEAPLPMRAADARRVSTKPDETAPASDDRLARPRQAGRRSPTAPSTPTTTTSTPTRPSRRARERAGTTSGWASLRSATRFGGDDDVNLEAYRRQRASRCATT